MSSNLTYRCLTFVATVATAISASAQTPTPTPSVATDPVGFIKTTIRGAVADPNGVNPPDPSLTLLGLSMTQPVEYQGAIVTYDAPSHSIAASNASWTNDQWNGTSGAYFVEITAGTNTGAISKITATFGTSPGGAATPNSIVAATDVSIAPDGTTVNLVGATLKIRKQWTLQSVFGPNANTNNQVILTGGGASNADEVLIYDRSDPANPQYVTYYYKQGGIVGGNGWRSTSGATPLSTDVSATPLPITEGLVVRRHDIGDVTLMLAGAVKLGATQDAVASGLNFTANVYAANLTLGNSGLYDANKPSTSLQGGGASNADQVLLFDGTQYITYYYKVGGITGGNGWRSTSGSSPLSTDVSSTPIAPGSSVIIQRFASLPFVWTTPLIALY